jgi:hypothetical protein
LLFAIAGVLPKIEKRWHFVQQLRDKREKRERVELNLLTNSIFPNRSIFSAQGYKRKRGWIVIIHNPVPLGGVMK